MQKKGEARILCIRDAKRQGRTNALPHFFSHVPLLHMPLLAKNYYSTIVHPIACPGGIGAFLLIAVFFAALAVAQEAPSGDANDYAMLEQVVTGNNNNVKGTGFIALESESGDGTRVNAQRDNAKTTLAPTIWTAGNVVLMISLTVLVVLFGYVAGIYHRERNAKKGMLGPGPSSRSRILRTPRAFAANARSHVRSAQQFFSRRMNSGGRSGARISHELESYLKHRQEPQHSWSARKPAQKNTSSYEDEYWQRQKEQFWSRVKRAADRIDNTPRAIQQLAVRQVQQYNEAMVQVRQAREDLYNVGDVSLTQEESTAKAEGVDKSPRFSDRFGAHVSTVAIAAQQQSILNQLREAHSI